MTVVSNTNTVNVGAHQRVELGDAPLFAQRATLAYTDTTAKDLFTLPAGAILIAFVIHVTTAFDDTGTDLIDLGDGTTADRFVADFDASSAALTLEPSAADDALAEATTIRGVYTGQNGNAANGAATVTALYSVPAE